MVQKPFKPTRWTLVALLMSAMMILMGGAAVAPALPLISAAFPDAPEAMVSLIITLPALAIALTGFFIGVLSDRVGKIPVLAGSVALFTIAGSSGFYLTSLPAILAGRFLVGVGIAGITCTTSALIVCYYDGISRAKVLGYQAAAMGIGVLILETSGGFLAGFSWHAAFLIYLLGIVILAGVLLTMKEPVRPELQENETIAEESFPVTSLMFAYMTLFFGNLLFFLLPTKFPYLLASLESARVVFGENTALASGIFLGISGCASSLVGLMYGRIAWRFNRCTILTLTFAFFGFGLCGLALGTSLVTMAISVICIGIGMGILIPTGLNWIATITPRAFLGKAMGGFSVSINLGQFVSTLAVALIVTIAATYANMFLVFGALAFILAIPFIVGLVKAKFKVVTPAGITNSPLLHRK